MKFEGGTQEQYDTVHSHLDVDANPPEGLVLHSAGPIEGGWGIIDFWDSREAFDTFASDHLGPGIRELGDRAMPNPPDIREFAVHCITKP